jgi:hypothetical protein
MGQIASDLMPLYQLEKQLLRFLNKKDLIAKGLQIFV